MGSMKSDATFDHLRDVLGNLPMAKAYTLLCLCFHLRETTSIDDIVQSLKQALERLSIAFPYLLGGVYFEGKGDGNTGTSRIVALRDSIELVVKDFRDDSSIPSMSELSKAKYPMSMLDGDILCPRLGIPVSYEESESKPAPVMVVQANFVKGGLLLTFAGNHTTMDMNGLGQFVCLFSKACNGEQFTDAELKYGNRSRTDAVELLGDDYVPGPELDDVTAQPRETSGTPEKTPAVRWTCINFSPSSLKKLKDQASTQTIVPYITTIDALSAFVWQRVSKAREARLGSELSTTLARAVNARKYVGLEQGYLGHMVDCICDKETDVWKLSLDHVAGSLRKTMQETDIGFHIRALATMLHRTADKTKYVYGSKLNFDNDVMMSSWAQIPCCQLEYGALLGVPEAARRPRMAPFGGIIYLMPKSNDGSIALAACLREDDLAKLQEDEVLTSYAEFIG